MRIGIIGLGSMGQMLVKSLCKSGVIQPEHITVFNRTREKAENLQASHGILIAESAQEVCDQANLVFLCTKPLDILPILRALSIPESVHIVSVAAGVSIDDLETVHAGAVSKVIPTVTSQELHGVSLFNAAVEQVQRIAMSYSLSCLPLVNHRKCPRSRSKQRRSSPAAHQD
ncbi:NAD(P)-binding domain-containing protein [Brevibacillus sp. BC25]|uniref:NAD(P)-binding domain-containing protein n=1 Tax=Brevibacillus sp. BC25 TaxID=1144308 RepID=UPI0002714FBE|nr:NAD(P)-binding domain-containing protein [Brevibacillus sp. BC25]EJL20211.1 pyrroline-5-carboxylate reductase [Brevibacillus sp. BC25]